MALHQCVVDCDPARISTLNCAEMAGDRSRQPACEIFSIKHII